MPDITMCRGEGCRMKDECYRHRAVPNEYRQSWFRDSPHEPMGRAGNEILYLCQYKTNVAPSDLLRPIEDSRPEQKRGFEFL